MQLTSSSSRVSVGFASSGGIGGSVVVQEYCDIKSKIIHQGRIENKAKYFGCNFIAKALNNFFCS
jgi:hypothetical protein